MKSAGLVNVGEVRQIQNNGMRNLPKFDSHKRKKRKTLGATNLKPEI